MCDTTLLKMEQAAAHAKECNQCGFHCAESVIRACAGALNLRLSDDILRVASGFRGGGGGYMDRCGVVEVGSMLIGYLYGRLLPQQSEWDYSYLICLLHERFKEHFGSLYCRDILPVEMKNNPEEGCIRTYMEGSELVTKLLLEAQEILHSVAPEDRDKRIMWFPVE